MSFLSNPGKKSLLSFGTGVVSGLVGLPAVIGQACSALSVVFGAWWVLNKTIGRVRQ
ncbi:MAG: hypothetical protein NZL83_01015 [Candidatus Absconditabacterales bacterium]|nr:hypothetical protein [Candidatus Absconditabacterales bacterium]